MKHVERHIAAQGNNADLLNAKLFDWTKIALKKPNVFLSWKLNMAFNLNLSHDLTTQNSVFHTQQIRIPTTPPVKPSQLYMEKQEVHGFEMSKYRVSWGKFDTSRTWKQSIVSSFSRFLC